MSARAEQRAKGGRRGEQRESRWLAHTGIWGQNGHVGSHPGEFGKPSPEFGLASIKAGSQLRGSEEGE